MERIGPDPLMEMNSLFQKLAFPVREERVPLGQSQRVRLLEQPLQRHRLGPETQACAWWVVVGFHLHRVVRDRCLDLTTPGWRLDPLLALRP